MEPTTDTSLLGRSIGKTKRNRQMRTPINTKAHLWLAMQLQIKTITSQVPSLMLIITKFPTNIQSVWMMLHVKLQTHESILWVDTNWSCLAWLPKATPWRLDHQNHEGWGRDCPAKWVNTREIQMLEFSMLLILWKHTTEKTHLVTNGTSYKYASLPLWNHLTHFSRGNNIHWRVLPFC